MTEKICMIVAAIAVLWLVCPVDAWRLPKPKPKPEPQGYISCYRAPFSDNTEYLCAIPLEENAYYYSRYRRAAHVFPTRIEAQKVTPVYDGSDGIECRAWVEPV